MRDVVEVQGDEVVMYVRLQDPVHELPNATEFTLEIAGYRFPAVNLNGNIFIGVDMISATKLKAYVLFVLGTLAMTVSDFVTLLGGSAFYKEWTNKVFKPALGVFNMTCINDMGQAEVKQVTISGEGTVTVDSGGFGILLAELKTQLDLDAGFIAPAVAGSLTDGTTIWPGTYTIFAIDPDTTKGEANDIFLRTGTLNIV